MSAKLPSVQKIKPTAPPRGRRGRFDAPPEETRWGRTLGLLLLHDVAVAAFIIVVFIAAAATLQIISELSVVQAAGQWLGQMQETIEGWIGK